MSSVDRERSWHDGQPVWFYRFVRGSRSWCYVASDRGEAAAVSEEHAGETYLPAAITRSEISEGSEQGREGIRVTMPAALDVADNWRPYPPSDPVALTIFVRHAGETDVLAEWTGRAVVPAFTRSALELQCEPFSTQGRRDSSLATWTRGCTVPLYSMGLGMCNLDPEPVEVPAVLDAVDELTLTLTAAGFSLAPRSLAGGVLVWLDEEEVPQQRSIVAHEDMQITIDSWDAALLPDLAVVAVTLPLWIEGTVSAVSGLTVTVPGLNARPNNWFAGGFVEWVRDDELVERRSIDAHTGNAITVQYGALDLAPELLVRVYPGCAHTWAACGALGNQQHYPGSLWMPGKTPYDGTPVW